MNEIMDFFAETPQPVTKPSEYKRWCGHCNKNHGPNDYNSGEWLNLHATCKHNKGASSTGRVTNE